MKLSALLIGASLAPAAASLLGGLKDTHGCYVSAGYTWCESSQKCLRLWEEGCSTDSDEDVTTTTTAAADDSGLLGGDTDNSGCLTSAGYQFCPELKECVRYWETNDDGETYASLCPTMMKDMDDDADDSDGRRLQLIGGSTDNGGCLTSAGYTWCESSNKCIRPWEEGCEDDTATTTTDAKSDQDCASGFTWCESFNKCVFLSRSAACPSLTQDR
mmetsp:Transcript_48886/g.72633  ORF Transcript_48886/g.72633 Transcript_48886/m.72633 type:complete len:216 (-) Transcript_48886:186-833(-)|eukprot:CAMPEP_0195523352 /NCGR_PEP_ID=MMETSP0794_2-20130614/22427_1 /TAXON_ID=515487 /ORGANISM="Stephanopyxis turris, Strain CCMP 815" /LENGTH=215 /DNA_ID=CAMNT_0040653337 /DNA_START=73 /DNA_END=720 /DNA_ORIENTATION=-